MIVSNTTPISNLIQLDLIGMLEKLFGEISIPEAVVTELDEGDDFLGNWREKCSGIIKIVAVQPDPIIEQLLLNLHPGEAEALALAVRLKAKIFLCDDMDARKFAHIHGIKVTGTIGILLKGKLSGYIDEISPYLENLRNNLHFWFTDELYYEIKAIADE